MQCSCRRHRYIYVYIMMIGGQLRADASILISRSFFLRSETFFCLLLFLWFYGHLFLFFLCGFFFFFGMVELGASVRRSPPVTTNSGWRCAVLPCHATARVVACETVNTLHRPSKKTLTINPDKCLSRFIPRSWFFMGRREYFAATILRLHSPG